MTEVTIINKRTAFLAEEEKQRLIDIYEESFSAPPRKEIIDRVLIYNEMFSKDNFITMLLIDDKINGYVFSTKIEDFGDASLLNLGKQKACYISAIAILKESRDFGYGKEMLSVHTEYLWYFFDTVYTRSRIDIPNIVKIFTKAGFEIVLTYETTTNKETSMKHIYKKTLGVNMNF